MKNTIRLTISLCFALLISFSVSYAQSSSSVTKTVPTKKREATTQKTVKSMHPGKIQVVKRNAQQKEISVYKLQTKSQAIKKTKMAADLKKETPNKEE